MRQTIYEMWNSVMNADHNPLRHIPSLQTRHMILQFLHGHGRVVSHSPMVVCGYGGFQWSHTCVSLQLSWSQLQHLKLQRENHKCLMDIMVERMVENTNEKNKRYVGEVIW